MSRAVESQLLLAIAERQEQAYKAISSALSLTTEGLIEVEILPKSHLLPEGQYVLRDGRAVAVSKPGLVAAFFAARKRLLAHRQLSSGDDRLERGTPMANKESEALAATSVILLTDAEHLTAANTRKRCIKEAIRRGSELDACLEHEKLFILSMLGSRLHRHNKSPTLWSHLRWVMEVSIGLGLDINEAFDEQLSIILTAAERHPRNYYAWCYARWLTEGLLEPKLRLLLQTIREWCIQHHDDTSAWSFLHFLLMRDEVVDTLRPSHCFEEVLSLTATWKWTNEAVWVFLRTLAASSPALDSAAEQLQHVLRSLLGDSAASDGPQADVLKSTSAWLTRVSR
jgi:protein prenyltransferase alpha subunit repeat containing protein 1